VINDKLIDTFIPLKESKPIHMHGLLILQTHKK